MSRAERERWQLASERWPTLQHLVSGDLADEILGNIHRLPERFATLATTLSADTKKKLASKCWDLRSYLVNRYDDVGLLRDALGAQGKLHSYPKDNGLQPGLKRIMLLYDALAHSIRADAGDWKP